MKISLRRRHALIVEDGAFSHKIDYTLHPGCLNEPDGDPIELFIPCYPLEPCINRLVIRYCLTALFLILESGILKPRILSLMSINKQTKTNINTIQLSTV